MGLRYTAYKLLKTILFTVYTQGTPGLNSSFSPFIYLLTIVLKNWFCLIYLTYFSSLTVILGGTSYTWCSWRTQEKSQQPWAAQLAQLASCEMVAGNQPVCVAH